VPLSLDEVAMDCTCERWPMPCVHLAATCYALARSFEEDPFGVFAWRGRHRDELLSQLRELRGAGSPASTRNIPEKSGLSVVSDSPDSEKYWSDAFWGGEASPAAVTGRPGAVSRPDALLDQLDPPPLAHGGRPIADLLRPAYLALPEE